jgi:hypothetical protein
MKREDVKVALVLHGLVGSIKGKHFQNYGGTEEVLQKSYNHNQKFILDQYNSDVFLHSWSTDVEDEILRLYEPKEAIIEPQIQFEVPDYIKAKKERAFAHLSRWYSFFQAVNQIELGEQYTHVMVQRFDLCWNVTPKFEDMNPDFLWVGKSTLNPNKEWSDRWFCSGYQNMLKFSTLFHGIHEYMSGDNPIFGSNRQWSGISSHFLTKFHAGQLGLKEKFIYNFGGYGQKPNDYNEVRRQYYNDDK